MSEEKKDGSADAGLITLAFTAVTYAAAFTFNASYLSHFGMPLRFAQVELRDLFVCGAGLLTFAGLIHGAIVL